MSIFKILLSSSVLALTAGIAVADEDRTAKLTIFAPGEGYKVISKSSHVDSIANGLP